MVASFGNLSYVWCPSLWIRAVPKNCEFVRTVRVLTLIKIVPFALSLWTVPKKCFREIPLILGLTNVWTWVALGRPKYDIREGQCHYFAWLCDARALFLRILVIDFSPWIKIEIKRFVTLTYQLQESLWLDLKIVKLLFIFTIEHRRRCRQPTRDGTLRKWAKTS